MSSQRRVQLQPAYILHHRPFRDSSQILDIVTQDFGKISVVSRGSRGGKSKLAGVLRPFLPLKVSWVARSDLGTLTGAEANGAPAGVTGDALLSAYYVNELMLNFLHRHDPQPEIFALYRQVLDALVMNTAIAASLRAFELEFLSLLGYAVNLTQVSGSSESVDSAQHYEYRMEQGLVAVARTSGRGVFRGSVLRAIAEHQFEDATVLRAASQLLRDIVAFHLGGKELKSRKVLKELHRGRLAQSRKED